MASMFSKGMSSTVSKCTKLDEVYVATVPLRASKGPAQLLMSTAYSLNLWNMQHYMVIIKPSSHPRSQAIVCDFQPKDPENVLVALAALSGRKVPGVVLMRKLKKLPRKDRWFVGYSSMDDIHTSVILFNERWETDLRIGHHDCRHYTKGLVEYLTDEEIVLEHLRSGKEML